MNQERFDDITRALATGKLSRRQILKTLGVGVLLSGPLGTLWPAEAKSIALQGRPPAAPSNLSAQAVDSSSIRLQWADKSFNESGFEISNGVTSNTVGANVKTYTWTGLAPGTYMCFQVRSFNSSGKSAFTPSACAQTAKPPQKPFPQHSNYANRAIKPNHVTQAQLDNATKTFYDAWKNHYLKSGCKAGTYYVWVSADGPTGGGGAPNSISFSEGHGYGMMITAIMAGYDPQAKTYFDGLYQFFKDHPSTYSNDLMAWNQVKLGCKTADPGTATDGDLDIAYALLLADKQWGSGGNINYLQEAKNVINAIIAREINSDTSLPLLADGQEDWLQDNLNKYTTRPSDFVGDHMRAYQSATGDARWMAVTNAIYTLIETMQTNYSPSTGLLPDFVKNTNTVPAPADAGYLDDEEAGQYSYEVCRLPWRIGTDYLMWGDSRALNALDKINTWIRSETGGNPGNIVDGYELDGTPTGTRNAMAFVAPFGVGAMVSDENQQWLNAIWDLVEGTERDQSDYFGNTIKVLAMITMSGNWWNATA